MYAVCIYHDENGDDECNKNMFGVPKEGYAFSKNFRPKFSVPDFFDCAFPLKENKTVTIKLVY